MFSTLCETKSPRSALADTSLGEVGRNSPCPCGSGFKYKAA
ncbi:MAG: SEC-C domain-containing protein [Bryobacterales bacterium]|nr:SEC-C domain-containing protein [Bryobacterales bacterium]